MHTLMWVFIIASAVAGVILLIRHQQIVARKCTVQYNESLSISIQRAADSLIEQVSKCRTFHEFWFAKDLIHRHLRLIEESLDFLDSIKSRECFRRQPAKFRNQQSRALKELRLRIIASREALYYCLKISQHYALPVKPISLTINSI